MPLNLIHGPPNSGRAGLVRERFTAALPRDPLLVVPNVDDVYTFERELAGSGRDALLGGKVATFEALFGEVAATAGLAANPSMTAAQRLRLVREAVARTPLRVLARSAERPGFAIALDELIGELRAAGTDPDGVAAAAGEPGEAPYLAELASLYRSYLGLCEELDCADEHATAVAAIAALRRDPDLWRGRPVLLYGFDDLTGEQLELVEALARAAEVTVALTYEDRAALAARARLLEALRDLGASERATEPNPANTASSLLFRLERTFLTEAAERTTPDESLAILRSAGERGEAEAIGSEIAALIAAGTDPGAIAVALREPASAGPLYQRVLGGLGIPVAVEAEIPVSRTATGATLAALLRAALGSGSAADLLTYLRGPRRAPPAGVDWLERKVRRRRIGDAPAVAAALAEQSGEAPAAYERLRALAGDRPALLRECANLARDIAEWPLARPETRGVVPGPGAALELRAAAAIAAALEQLGELGGLEPAAAELITILDELRMPLWRGPAAGRVRVASPYRLRASRFEALFVASLQDGEFPRHGGGSPFLSDEQRAALGLPERAEAEAEERYLFYACLSLPTDRLFLSYRGSDEEGVAEARSPFIDEIRRLLDPPPPADGGADPVEAALTRGRALSEVVFAPEAAPSEDELARSLAVRGADPGGLAVPRALAERIGERLARARAATLRPVGLRNPHVLGELAEREGFGGTTLEGFAVCSYRWFVGHELDPGAIEPRPDPLTQGNLLHEALHRLYREQPGGDPLPRRDSLERWRRRSREIAAEVCDEAGLSRDHPTDRATRRRVSGLIEALLEREADRPAVALPDPELLEASFGEETERGPLELDGLQLHGRIDRVDVAPSGGVVRDYKLGKATRHEDFAKQGKLQLPLYMVALRELWGIEPLAGLYQSLSATRDPRPRGLGLTEQRDGDLVGVDLPGTDWLEREEFEEVLRVARGEAARIVGEMRGGRIRRNPIEGTCPSYCTYAPICRRERGPIAEREPPEAEEESLQ